MLFLAVFGCDNWHLTHIAAINEEERGIKQTNRRNEETQHFDTVTTFHIVFSTGRINC